MSPLSILPGLATQNSGLSVVFLISVRSYIVIYIILAYSSVLYPGFSILWFQADICHAYQIVRDHGIPDDHIIVMMADDIAYNPSNPNQGEIYNEANIFLIRPFFLLSLWPEGRLKMPLPNWVLFSPKVRMFILMRMCREITQETTSGRILFSRDEFSSKHLFFKKSLISKIAPPPNIFKLEDTSPLPEGSPGRGNWSWHREDFT